MPPVGCGVLTFARHSRAMMRWNRRVALTATIYNFEIDLSDTDRGRYESLALRVARHPSESGEFLVARVLAYCLEYTGGISFSKGLCDPDEAAIVVRDLTGRIRSWIEVGTPDAARLHRAAKAAPRVVVYTHKDPAQWVKGLAGERIHNADALELYALDRSLVGALTERLDRRVAFALSVADRDLFVSIGRDTLIGAVRRIRL